MHRLRTFMLTFYIKVFRTSLFPNSMMDLVHVWCDDRYWSKLLHSAITTPIHDFKVKVTDLELFMLKFCVKVFRTLLFPKVCFKFYNVCFCEAFDGLIHVWHGDRNWSKILYGTIPNPEGHRLRIFI